jgi:chaperonin cofactor prefoldin
MSKAAFCSQCGTNVWVNENGDCANGHPRSSLRDEYEVDPQPTAGSATPLVGSAGASQSSRSAVPVGEQDTAQLKRAVADAWKSLRIAKQRSANCLAQLNASRATVDDAANRLEALRSGKGALLANLVDAGSVYEYWIELPGYSGPVAGATARMSQTGDVHDVSHVQSTSKSGVGGALAGGLGGTLVGGPLIGAAGAILGNNMARKTKVNTTVSQVDTRKIELEIVGPGYAWSDEYWYSAMGKVREFKDRVNARGSAPQDLDKQTESQEARVAELRDQMRRVTESNDAAAQEVRTAQLRHQQALGEYAATARTFWDKSKVVFTAFGTGAALPPAIKSTRLILIAGAVGLVLLSCTICGDLGSPTEPTNPASTTTSFVSTATAQPPAAVQPVPKPPDVMLPAAVSAQKKARISAAGWGKVKRGQVAFRRRPQRCTDSQFL